MLYAHDPSQNHKTMDYAGGESQVRSLTGSISFSPGRERGGFNSSNNCVIVGWPMWETVTPILFTLHLAITLLKRSAENISNEQTTDLLQGVGSNLVYDLLKKGGLEAVSLIVARLKANNTPQGSINRHLQKAVRRAQLSATLLALQAYWKQITGKDPNFLDKVLKPVGKRFLGPEEQQIIEVRKWLLESLRELDRSDEYGPYNIDYDDLFQLMRPLREGADSAELQDFASRLKRRTIDELYSLHPSMGVLANAIEHGWEIQIDEDRRGRSAPRVVRCDWFSLVYEYFGEEYKQGREVTQALNRLLFYETRDGVEDLPSRILTSHFEEIGGNVLSALNRLDDKQDEILREVRRRPFYVRWQGKEYADRVERAVLENSALVVGRDDELAALDDFIGNNSSGYYLIKGGPGLGKSALLAAWVRSRRFEGRFVAYHFFSRRHETTDVNSAFRNLLSQLRVYYEIEELLPTRDESRETIYGLLQERRVRRDEPLVIVLDALDEASAPFSPPFSPLPENVFVIVSVRAEDYDAGLPYLREWTSITKQNTRTLAGLGITGIGMWLEHERRRQNEKLSLSQMKTDQEIAKSIHEKTGGLPLYLSYLLPAIVEKTHGIEDDEFRHDALIRLLNSTPTTFSKYLVEQYRELCGEVSPIELRSIARLFHCLSVALGPVSTYDVWKISGLEPENINHLMLHPKARRWFRWRETENNQAFFYFDHPLIQKVFRETVLIDTGEVFSNLLKFCNDWRNHPSSTYSFRYYPEHLFASNQWELLFDLTRDEEFLNAQEKAVPDEPDISLRTLQRALNAAMEIDNAGAMVEFSLRHSSRVLTIENETPLRALEVSGLQRALNLAELQFVRDKERGALWYLDLALQLKLKNRSEEARKILSTLSSRECARLREGFSNLAIIALAALLDIDDAAWIHIQSQLLDAGQRVQLVVHLCRTNIANQSSIDNRFSIALLLAQQIKEPLERVPALKAIARAQASNGDPNAALETIDLMEFPWARMETLSDIGRRYLASGDRDSAIKCRRSSFAVPPREHSHYDLITAIARSQAEDGELQAAIASIMEIEKRERRAESFLEIAAALAIKENRVTHRTLLQHALQAAREEEVSWQRFEVLDKIARAFVLEGEFSIAFEIAREIDDPIKRVRSFGYIRLAQSATGDREGAKLGFQSELATAADIRDREHRAVAFAQIAAIQAEVGDLEGAQTCIDAALDNVPERGSAPWWSEALPKLLRALFRNGQRQLALETVASALTSDHKRASLGASIASALAAEGELDKALELAAQSEAPWNRARSLAAIATALLDNGSLATAIDIVRQIQVSQIQIETFARLAAQLLAKNDVEPALQILRDVDLMQHTKYLVEFVPLLAANGEIALALIISLTHHERSEREKALKKLITVLAEDGTRESVANALEQVASKIGDPLERAVVVANISRFAVENGNLQLAVETIPYAIGTEPLRKIISRRVEAIIEIAKAWAINDKEEATAALQIAKAMAHTMEASDKRVELLLEIGQQLCGIGQAAAGLQSHRSALSTARELGELWSRSTKITDVVQSLLANGELDAAFQAASEISDPKKQAEVMVGVAQGFAAGGERAKALKILKIALEATHSIDETWRLTLMLERVAKLQSDLGDLAGARDTSQQIVAPESRARVWAEIARGQSLIGDPEAASQFFQYASDTVSEIEGPETRYEAVRMVGRALAESGRIDAAMETMLTITDSWKRSVALHRLGSKIIARGNRAIGLKCLRMASETARGIENDWNQGLTLGQITKTLLQNGETVAALEAAHGIRSWRREIAMATVFFVTGDHVREQESFKQAVKAAMELSEPFGSSEILGEIAFAQVGCAELFGAIETALKIPFAYKRAGVLAEMSQIFTNTGKQEAALDCCNYALETLPELELSFDPNPILATVARCQASCGQLMPGMQTARQIEDANWRTMVLAEIAREQAGDGQVLDVSLFTQTFIFDRENTLPYVAEAFAEHGDKVRFKQFLVPCAYFREAAIRMAGLLSRFYAGQPERLRGVLAALQAA